MKDLIFKNKKEQDRFCKLYNENKDKISEDLKLLIKNVIVIFKRYSSDENYYTLTLIYWLLHFKIIEKSHPIIEKNDLKRLWDIIESFQYEMKWDYKNFLYCILKMDRRLFFFKTVIKYSILSFEKKFKWITPNPENYYKSIGYVIPYLTYIESPLLSFFQDFYFKKVYPRKYQKIKKYYYENIISKDMEWSHMYFMVNSLWVIMQESWTFWITKVRRKAYFSMYNKMIRKQTNENYDNIWIRILFKNNEELKKFTEVFEYRYMFSEKKDYVNNPKENWYQSMHYRFLSPFRDTNIIVELQLRTIEMNTKIHNDSLSHFMYTINENKWAKQFKEIHKWYQYILKFLD